MTYGHPELYGSAALSQFFNQNPGQDPSLRTPDPLLSRPAERLPAARTSRGGQSGNLAETLAVAGAQVGLDPYRIARRPRLSNRPRLSLLLGGVA